ncbi:MAG: PEP-CTERM sorting domain-containing protein [Candidatus Omnitrophica bacterium]|nr:PEP-CTERM sorting domain-containing protein [Candidatus Omnitrophota bacterium]
MRKVGLVMVLLLLGMFLATGTVEAVVISNMLDPLDPLYFSVDVGPSGSASSMYFSGGNQVYEYNSFLDIDGSVFDLNDFDVTSQMSGVTMDYQYVSQVYSSGTIDVTVLSQIGLGSQRFQTNYSIMPSVALTNVNFFQYLDADLGAYVSDDFATTSILPSGSRRLILYDSPPSLISSIGLNSGGMSEGLLTGWEIDEYSTLLDNISSGNYDLRNGIFSSQPADQTMALQWTLGNIAANASFNIESEVTVIPVPEPMTMLLFGPALLGLVGFKRRKA